MRPHILPHTDRLLLRPVDERTEPARLLPVFNSNRDWVEAMNDFAGQTEYTLDDVEHYLWVGSMMTDSACLELLDRSDSRPVGVLSYVVADQPGPEPAVLASLVIDAAVQRRGLGSEALAAVETGLRDVGVTTLRAAPAVALLPAREFLAANGFEPVEERRDQDDRPCLVMEKQLGQ